MCVLVTGGAGFIGSHLTERLLADGHEVVVVDDFNAFYDPKIKRGNVALLGDRIHLVESDIRDRAAMLEVFQKFSPEMVIHLAARAGVRPSIDNPEIYISTNISGTFNLLDAAREVGTKRFIFASSSSVYGLNEKVPFAEDDLITKTISPYAATKIAGEQLCSNYAHLYDIETICLRFFTVYGPRQRPDLAISKFTRLILEGRPIDRYGDGESGGRDYTFVEDIVGGIMGAVGLEGCPFDIFNLGGSRVWTLNELIASVEGALGKKAEINEMPHQPGDVPITSADISKARRILGYAPETTLTQGVPKFVEWYLKHHSLKA